MICGHHTLLAGSNCYLVFDQLQRINIAAERNRLGIPFEIPPECLPNRNNVRYTQLNEYCSWECRNNGLYVDRRCGTRDAQYGQYHSDSSEMMAVG
jgi:hypothetical protein